MVIFGTRVISNLEWSTTPVTTALQHVLGPKLSDLLGLVCKPECPWDAFDHKHLISLRAKALLTISTSNESNFDSRLARKHRVDSQYVDLAVHNSDSVKSRRELLRQGISTLSKVQGSSEMQYTQGITHHSVASCDGSPYHAGLGTPVGRPASLVRKNRPDPIITKGLSDKYTGDASSLLPSPPQTQIPNSIVHLDSESTKASPINNIHSSVDRLPILDIDRGTQSPHCASPSPRTKLVPVATLTRMNQNATAVCTRVLSRHVSTDSINLAKLSPKQRVRKLSATPAPFYPSSARMVDNIVAKTRVPGAPSLSYQDSLKVSRLLSGNSVQHDPQDRTNPRPAVYSWPQLGHQGPNMDSLIEEQLYYTAAMEESSPRKAVLADFMNF